MALWPHWRRRRSRRLWRGSSGLFQKFDLAGGEAVGCADYFELSGFDAWADDGVEVREAVYTAADVGSDGVLEGVPGEMLALEDGGLDAGDEIVDGPGQGVLVVQVFDGGFDRAALAVAEDHEEIDAQLSYSVLNTAFDGGPGAVDVVSGDADDEEVSDAEVEEDLWRDARVGAGDDAGDGVLAFGERLEVCRGSTRVGDGS
jgi:hypothetical protein